MAVAAGEQFVGAPREVERELLRDEIAKHRRLMAPPDSLGLEFPSDDEALQQRDVLFRERGGINGLQPARAGSSRRHQAGTTWRRES